MVRAGIYTRISEDDGTRLGVTRQRRDCEELCIARGWTITSVYEDNDFSAYRNRARPAYQRLLADLASHSLDAVVVWHLDRLTRRPSELEEFFEACARASVTRFGTVSGDIDLGTADGQFHARILGAVARKSSDDASRRLRRKATELAERGLPNGGRAFGYRGITLIPEEAEIIRSFVDRLLAGATLTSLASELNERGISGAHGGRWTATSIKKMVQSGRIAGLREIDVHGSRRVVGPAAWPAIITPAELERLRARLNSFTPQRPARSYLLSGMMVCGRCGARMNAAPQRAMRRYRCRYQDGGCGLGINADGVEGEVVGRLFVRLRDPDTPLVIARADTDALVAEIQAADARLTELAGMFGGGLSDAEWKAAREPVVARLEVAQRALRDIPTEGERITDLEERWSGLAFHIRRAQLRLYVRAVVIAPARYRGKFDPERVDPVWFDEAPRQFELDARGR